MKFSQSKWHQLKMDKRREIVESSDYRQEYSVLYDKNTFYHKQDPWKTLSFEEFWAEHGCGK